MSDYLSPETAAGYRARIAGPIGRYLEELESKPIRTRFGDLTGKRALDLGTGTGRFAEQALSARAAFVVGADIALPMLQVASRQLTDERLGWAVMDAGRPALRAEAFDLITAIGTFERLPEGVSLNEMLGTLAALLAPGGLVLMTAWNADRWLPWKWLDFTQPVAVIGEREVIEAAQTAGLSVEHLSSTLFEPRRLGPRLVRLGFGRTLVAFNRWMARHAPSRGRQWIVSLRKPR